MIYIAKYINKIISESNHGLQRLPLDVQIPYYTDQGPKGGQKGIEHMRKLKPQGSQIPFLTFRNTPITSSEWA